jgi:hypothetical protein
MQKYIRQLIGDLYAVEEREAQNQAHKPAPCSFEEEMELVEAWIYDTGPHCSIGALLQLEAIQFPPAERLNRRQLRAVCEAYEYALQTFAIAVNFPKRLPWATRYRLLVELLDHEVSMFNGSGFVDIDLCNYDTTNCPFGSRYCTCKKMTDCEIEYDLDLSERARNIVQTLRLRADLLPGGKPFQIHEIREEKTLDTAKPIAEWLGIDAGAFPAYEAMERYDDIIGISDAIMGIFPELSWGWIIDCELRERYEIPLKLLKVKAHYDFLGNFYVTNQEMAFFNRIFAFYFDRRYRKRQDDSDSDDLPF